MSMPVHAVFFQVALALSACSCPRSPGTPAPPPPIPQDASTVDGAAYTPCDMACTRYRQLGCPEGAPTSEGHSCEEVCQNAASHGVDLAGPVACTSAAPACEDVRKCSGG